jgi:hypothetical protein
MGAVMSAATPWRKPADVSDLEMAFGTTALKLMPLMSEIPEEFKRDHNRWVKVQQDWFFYGLKGAKWTPKNGIEPEAALRHLKVIQGSWEPKHEHKQAAVAYLISLWFEDVTYELGKPR